MDKIIIEHLACLEINRIILQEPYKLVSEVQFNDKTPCFDGEIIVYNTNELKKDNIEDSVKVQIKGTTLFKKIKNNGKITHPINKSDLEVYKKTGKGVLYLVVAINKMNKKVNSFYNSLTPLEIERLLGVIEKKKQDSLSVDFKMLNDRDLDYICRAHIKNVRKQPSNFIQMENKKEYEKYIIEYDVTPSEVNNFNLFDNIAYVYGVEGDFEYPIESIIPEAMNFTGDERTILLGEETNVKYNLTETKDEIILLVEDTLKFNLSKKNKTGNLKMGRLRTISSYLISLKVLKYILEEKRFPLDISNITANINEHENFQNIDEDIEKYSELQNICKRIGISSEYQFNNNEDLEQLFNGIHDIFNNKNYKAINYNATNSDSDIESNNILRLKLSNHITLLLFRDSKDDLYYNIFDNKVFDRMAAFIPKNPGEFNPNSDDYFKVSIFSSAKIQDLYNLTNFDFEIYEKSFSVDKHDKSLEFNNQIAIDLITIYDETKDCRFLNLAETLLIGLIETREDNSIYRMNLLQIKRRNLKEFEKHEEDFLYNILEKESDQIKKFVVNVILGLKTPAERLLDKMDVTNKAEVMGWPIYNLYLEL
ncbi:hypothetical protein [Lysinibacillus sphaericus]|uniref:hypothetical protein n=1 Tax=Lysinibacillus sphaericus TaxID=1421 RepID=UPI0004DFA55F|nr:hypothetical protein [Lysinibacillus sphaericus]QPA60675.1 hypothetical protein INQ55_10255 [Lysinibacillus sphaericus]